MVRPEEKGNKKNGGLRRWRFKTSSWEPNALSWVLAHHTGGLRGTQIRVPGKLNCHSQEHNHTQLNPGSLGHISTLSFPTPTGTDTVTEQPPTDAPSSLFGPTRAQTLQTLIQSVWNPNKATTNFTYSLPPNMILNQMGLATKKKNEEIQDPLLKTHRYMGST